MITHREVENVEDQSSQQMHQTTEAFEISISLGVNANDWEEQATSKTSLVESEKVGELS